MPTTASSDSTRFFADPMEYRLGGGRGRRHPPIVADGRPGRPIAPALGLTRRPVVMEDKDEMPTTTSTALARTSHPEGGP